MKAVFYDRQGPAREVLQLGDLPDPEPGPGQVRVRVHVSAVNPSDTKGRVGAGGAPMPFPRIVPHQDGAGVVDRVGEGVDSGRLGERVWVYEAQRGRAGGTAAEYAVVPAHQAVRLPDQITFETGACLGVPAMTAHRCLFADGPVRGEWVFVQGGAGAVGQAAILLAKWAGAHVVTTVSRDAQAEVARASGADVIVNRRTDDVAARVRDASGGGVSRIVDVALPVNVDTDLACLRVNGVISAYASDHPDQALQFPFRRAMVLAATFRLVFVYLMSDAAHAHAAADVTAALDAGMYRPHVGLRLGLDGVAAGHEAQDSGTLVGKIVFNVP